MTYRATWIPNESGRGPKQFLELKIKSSNAAKSLVGQWVEIVAGRQVSEVELGFLVANFTDAGKAHYAVTGRRNY